MVIVMIHEYGHFYVARKCNVFIKTFSIGFGRKLWSYKSKSGTNYVIAAIPLGGYVDPLTQKDLQESIAKYRQDGKETAELDLLQNRTMESATAFQRFMIACAGPLINLLSAMILFTALYSVIGIREYRIESDTQIVEKYNLQRHDIIKNVIFLNSKGDVGSCERCVVCIMRNGKVMQIESKSTLHQAGHYNRVHDYIDNELVKNGIEVKLTKIKNPVVLLAKSGQFVCRYVKLIFQSVAKIFTFSKESRDSMGGFASIVKTISESLQNGVVSAINVIISLSIMLGALNLIPIPVFDGGRMLIEIVAMIIRRPISKKMESICNVIGVVFVLFLVLYSNGLDIFRFIFKK